MSKKILSEAQVRRFQTLATIRPLNEMGGYPAEEAEESPIVEEEEMEMGAEEAPEMDADIPEEAEEAEEADVELDEELVQKFVDAVATIQQVADALGGEEMEMGAEEEPMEMGAEEEPMDMDAEEAPAEDEEELQLQEALKGIKYVPSQKEVVKVVAQRVAKRLQEAKRAQAKLNKALGKK
jgi:hypothetical protein